MKYISCNNVSIYKVMKNLQYIHNIQKFNCDTEDNVQNYGTKGKTERKRDEGLGKPLECPNGH